MGSPASPDDLAARGRAIFAKLRFSSQEPAEQPDHDAQPADQPGREGDGVRDGEDSLDRGDGEHFEPGALDEGEGASPQGEAPTGDAASPDEGDAHVRPTGTDRRRADAEAADSTEASDGQASLAQEANPFGPLVDRPGADAAVVPATAPTATDDDQRPGAEGSLTAATSPGAEDAASEPEGPLVPRVIAIANQKGGVGKTTTAVNLGACLAEAGHRVLVVDLDPQGNASTGLGINIRGLQASMYQVILHDVPLEDCVEAASLRNLFVAPASLDLAGAEVELVAAFSRELRLKRAIDAVRDDYEFILIDCPPSLGLLTVNGLAAADEVLVPIQCEYYALEGLGQLLRNVGLVQKNLAADLAISTIVLVMYDARTKLADQVMHEVRNHFGDKVCRTVVPRTVRLSEAPSYGQPIVAFDPSSRGAVAYRELAKEVRRASKRAG